MGVCTKDIKCSLFSKQHGEICWDVTKTRNGMINEMINGMKVSTLMDLSWLLKDRNTHVIPLVLQGEQTTHAPAAYQCT